MLWKVELEACNLTSWRHIWDLLLELYVIVNRRDAHLEQWRYKRDSLYFLCIRSNRRVCLDFPFCNTHPRIIFKLRSETVFYYLRAALWDGGTKQKQGEQGIVSLECVGRYLVGIFPFPCNMYEVDDIWLSCHVPKIVYSVPVIFSGLIKNSRDFSE